MNPTSRRKSSSGTLIKRSTTKSRSTAIALQAECLYGWDSAVTGDDNGGAPMLARYLKGNVSLPGETSLQNTSRVIVMFKCFRELRPPGRGAPAPMIETVYSKFLRLWPPEPKEDATADTSAQPSRALTRADTRSRLEFSLLLPADLPQSIRIAEGSIHYTLQVQLNLRHPTHATEELAVYSHDIAVEVPAPGAAYSLSKLPKRITNGIVGHSQDHYGLLITPDISLHVSVPREILYSKRQHSVFKIHIKLMPHPPEAKLPTITKLAWKLLQKTNLGSVQVARNTTSKRIGIASAELASGQIILPAVKAGDEAMSGSRKDQYLYIALPENSAVLLPMYEDNKYLEILHSLEIELYAATEQAKANHFTKSAASFFTKTFSRGARRESASAATASTSQGSKQPWRAEVPIKLYFDPTEVAQANAAHVPFVPETRASVAQLAITAK